jgi:hypothetical protein
LIWLEYRVPQGSTGKLQGAIHAWRLLDRVGFGCAHPCFSLTVWFQRERFEALWLLISWSMVSRSMVLVENVMEARTSNGGLNFGGNEELAW